MSASTTWAHTCARPTTASSASGTAPRSLCTVRLGLLGWCAQQGLAALGLSHQAWATGVLVQCGPRVRGHSAPSSVESSPREGRAVCGWPAWSPHPEGQGQPQSAGVWLLGVWGRAWESLGSDESATLGPRFTLMPPNWQKSPSSASSGSRIPSWRPRQETSW